MIWLAQYWGTSGSSFQQNCFIMLLSVLKSNFSQDWKDCGGTLNITWFSLICTYRSSYLLVTIRYLLYIHTQAIERDRCNVKIDIRDANQCFHSLFLAADVRIEASPIHKRCWFPRQDAGSNSCSYNVDLSICCSLSLKIGCKSHSLSSFATGATDLKIPVKCSPENSRDD